MENFDELKLHERLRYPVLHELGFKKPTPIQAKAIPAILEGRDVIGLAKTGTGKTAAFTLPTLQRFLDRHFDADYEGPRILILSPTRELAYQAEQNIRDFAKYLDFNICLLLGGVPYKKQLEQLKNFPDLIVATPGRLLDHLEKRQVSLQTVDTFILDEGDRMLDMGFLPDIRRIIGKLGKQTPRQTMMFSATFPDPIARLASSLMNDPVRVDVTDPTLRTPEKIIQKAYYLEKIRKPRLLRELLVHPDMTSVMVFCGMKVEADFIYEVLKQEGASVEVIHSDREQRHRTRALEAFRENKVAILVATDIAARGIDIKDVTHVVNYDLPANFEDYLHRVGRTARAEAHGEAISFVTPADRLVFENIERNVGKPIERLTWPGITLDADWEATAPKPGTLTAASGGSQRTAAGTSVPRRRGRR